MKKFKYLMTLVKKEMRAGRCSRVDVYNHTYQIGHQEGGISPSVRTLIKDLTFPFVHEYEEFRYCPIERVIVEVYGDVHDVHGVITIYDFSKMPEEYDKKVISIKENIRSWNTWFSVEARMNQYSTSLQSLLTHKK